MSASGSRGVCVPLGPQGMSASGSGGPLDTILDTHPLAIEAGGTHPTGMHSCSLCSSYFLKKRAVGIRQKCLLVVFTADGRNVQTGKDSAGETRRNLQKR